MPFLTSTITQGAADAFVENQINTGLSGITNQAIRLLRVDVEFDAAAAVRPFAGAGAAQDVEISLTRRGKSASPLITDNQVLMKIHRGLQLWTAVGIAIFDQILSWSAPAPDATKLDDGAVLVIEDPVYLQLDSFGTGVALVGSCRIEYDTVKITTEDRLRLLELSLT